MFTAQGSNFQFFFAISATGVVPCGGLYRTSSIVQMIFSFLSFEISEEILRNQKFIIGLESFSYQSLNIFGLTRCDQKVLSLIHFKAFHKTKSLFSLSFYLIESHLESKKHLVTIDCFCTRTVRQTCKMEKVEVRAMIKYLCKKGITPKEFHEGFMKTLGNESLSYSTVKKWAAEFTHGSESIEDDARSGRPKDATTDENVEIVHNLVMVTSEVGINLGAVQTILADILGTCMSKVSARWVPRILTDDQKRSQHDISRYLLSRYEDDPGDFIDRVVTQDEKGVHHVYPESKMQSMQWKHPGSPPPKKFKRVSSAGR